MKKQNWYVNRKKFHFIYKTTCKINSKYYLGMHSTDNLEDGYIGSGTRLWHSIKKYGKENFSMEILEYLPDREALKKRERELINEDLLIDSLCMNLTLGGEGDWSTVNKNLTFEQRQKISKQSNAAFLNLLKNSVYADKFAAGCTDRLITAYTKGRKSAGCFGNENLRLIQIEKAKSSESIQKRRETYQKIGHSQGSKNSQYGKCWVFNENESRSISRLQLDQALKEGWKRGRRIKM